MARLSVLFILVVTGSPVLQGQQGATNGQCRASGGDGGQTRYAPLDQITRDNVKSLRVAWTFRMDNFSSPPEIRSQTSPVMANGDTPPQIKNHPKLASLQLPRTGSISHAGLLATRTLLFAGEGDGGMPMFRAHDKKTGEILWETQIPTGAQTGLPVTYMHGGKQYVVFAAGGAAGSAAQLVAYALP